MAFAVLGDEAANVGGGGCLSACEVDHATSVFGEADVEERRAGLGALGGSCHPVMVGEGVSFRVTESDSVTRYWWAMSTIRE